ncbi:hypothetical protein DDB_G0278399 [Dictyostelium discoideum AX4]|uniref:Carbohydrate binding domain-containing protein n=1 Tax=Dictyostelium discoideum TaxID=44689 RepID=Q54Y61_DICDI|nr:hypothetical protein DDB_G0278399 [Dictyostelium discoideum AX4]EAL68372.1 hypothetical protein DDB_G0278399 [Dictyostelium discoideum AX4]|eukprot:XP_642341.1 hypothetical protein DDB_G0278399 [Dictyostelium discoideum AX4]
MKFIITILLFALLTISFSSASEDSFQCGRYACLPGHSCICDNGVYRCVYVCEEVTIVQTITDSWVDSEKKPSVKVNVDVINHTHRTIKDIVIATDAHLNSGQIWGAHLNGFLLDFPDYVSIAPGQIHSFGYINRGTSAAHLWVQHVFISA